MKDGRTHIRTEPPKMPKDFGTTDDSIIGDLVCRECGCVICYGGYEKNFLVSSYVPWNVEAAMKRHVHGIDAIEEY